MWHLSQWWYAIYCLPVRRCGGYLPRHKCRNTEATTFTPIYKIRKYLWPLPSELHIDVNFGSTTTFLTCRRSLAGANGAHATFPLWFLGGNCLRVVVLLRMKTENLRTDVVMVSGYLPTFQTWDWSLDGTIVSNDTLKLWFFRNFRNLRETVG